MCGRTPANSRKPPAPPLAWPGALGQPGVARAGSFGLSTYDLHIRSDFAAAHRLRGYDGNCERLHGHNWRVDAVLRGAALDRLGMLVDFRQAKRLIWEVLDALDHRCLNDIEPFTSTNPTTENLARMIYEALATRLPQGVTVAKVTAWETDGCGASYTTEHC